MSTVTSIQKKRTNYFIYQWTAECCESMNDEGYEGKALGAAAGNVFRQRGVGPGDAFYVWWYSTGQLRLVGRMRVAKVWDREDWDRRKRMPIWPGQEVVEGEDGTPMTFDRIVEPQVLRNLIFTDWMGRPSKRLELQGNALKDPMSIRSVRQITADSAALLDMILETSH